MGVVHLVVDKNVSKFQIPGSPDISTRKQLPVSKQKEKRENTWPRFRAVMGRLKLCLY